MEVSGETERIQADGQIVAYLCGAEGSTPRPHGMMDHYSSLCINTNMLLNLVGRAEESQQAKMPYFKVAVRSMGGG